MSHIETTDKIRIMHITQSGGGVLRYIQMLLKYIDKSRFENIVICSYASKREDYGENIIYFDQVKMEREISLSDLPAVIKVRKLIKKYAPDIVYAHSSKGGAIARIANIGLKNKCIYNPHGWSFNMQCSPIKRLLYKEIERIASHFCDKIICISEAEKQSALENKICNENKLQVIWNGIDIEEYEKSPHGLLTRASLNIPEDAFVVGMVGRICPQKAPDIFIRVASRIKASIPNSYFIIVGNGEMEGEIRKYAQENHLTDSLLITGWVNNTMSYIELFDVAMLLSRWEGFGLVLPEYMLAGKPIVATKVDAIPCIIQDGKNGILIEKNNIGGASKAVIELYNKRDLVEKIINKEIKDVYTKFDIKRVVREHENLLINTNI